MQASCLSQRMQVRWAEREGVAWIRDGDKLPYFLYCADCHIKHWPGDLRTNNRHSRPGGVVEGSMMRRVRGGTSETVAGTFHLTAPSPLESRDLPLVLPYCDVKDADKRVSGTSAPPSKRFKSKQSKTVTWSDKGQWCRTMTNTNWARPYEVRMTDLYQAHAFKLVTTITPELDMERKHDYFRTGPCDSCSSRSVSRTVCGALRYMPSTKNTFQFCEQCFKRFNKGEALPSHELDDFLLLA